VTICVVRYVYIYIYICDDEDIFIMHMFPLYSLCVILDSVFLLIFIVSCVVCWIVRILTPGENVFYLLLCVLFLLMQRSFVCVVLPSFVQ